MRLLPLFQGIRKTPGAPPSVGPELRGVAIHWVGVGAPVSREGRRFRPFVPEPSWRVSLVPFRALTLNGADQPPATVVEREQMVRHAYAITAAQHSISSSSTVYYEVGTWRG